MRMDKGHTVSDVPPIGISHTKKAVSIRPGINTMSRGVDNDRRFLDNSPAYLGWIQEGFSLPTDFESLIRRWLACPPSRSETGIRVSWPSTVIKTSASQGGKSTALTGIAKSWATCERGMHNPAARSSKVTSAEWLVLGAIMTDPRSILARGNEYCRRRDCVFVADRIFGCGVHGSVFGCIRTTSDVQNALKIHEHSNAYRIERDVYLRLRELGIDLIQGHNVPQLIDYDDDLLVIEISVVVRPFVLDFGGAYLDRPQDYDDEILEEWRREKAEQFEGNWPKASSILAELRGYGIYVADVNPGNIGFVERTDLE